MDNWIKQFSKKMLKMIGIFSVLTFVIFGFYFIRKKEITIDYLGHKYQVKTLSNTVRSVIKSKKIYIDDTYSISPNLDSVIKSDTEIKIEKNEQLAYLDLDKDNKDIEYVKIEEEKQIINYEVEEKENNKLYKGKKKLIQKGENGEKVTVYRTVYKGDNRVKRDVLYEHARQPISERVEIGTKEETIIARGESISASASDLDVLASLIQAEAGGEPYLGKVAVGAVCVNRLKTGRYGGSIRNVIYAPNQFCTVRLGMLRTVSKDSDSYRAAVQAFNGDDPSNGSLYFYNPRTASSSWSKSRPVKAKIGNHVFTI